MVASYHSDIPGDQVPGGLVYDIIPKYELLRNTNARVAASSLTPGGLCFMHCPYSGGVACCVESTPASFIRKDHTSPSFFRAELQLLMEVLDRSADVGAGGQAPLLTYVSCPAGVAKANVV